ncbi:MAG: hypothetical protein LBC64_07200 [Fibromonadaceae bacterium]|jgi:hypothetical protein|nr:hypothetical protein [Fibromonadaceae bacterium]
MNKILAPIACIMAVAMFSACGSQDVPDDTPAWPNYSGYTDLDNEPDNNSEEKAPAIVIGSARSINFKGVLDNFWGKDGNGRPALVMDEDYYKIQLEYRDTISITASNQTNIPSPFSVKFYGPCSPLAAASDCADVTLDVLNITNSLPQLVIGTGHVDSGGELYAPATFYIKVSNVANISQANLIYRSTPYAITITKKRR